MISCKNVARLLTSDQLQSQSWWKRMEVQVHLAMCLYCSRLARQLQQLRSGSRQLRDQFEADKEFEKRLINRLSGR